MPELPDVTVYVERLTALLAGQPLERVRLASPFLLRTVDPPPAELEGRTIEGARRLGKRVVLALEGARFAVLHLMIAGRLRWAPPRAKVPARLGLAAFEVPTGTLLLTEAGTQRRASLHLVRGEDALAAFDPGGLEVLEADLPAFAAALARENRTLRRMRGNRYRARPSARSRLRRGGRPGRTASASPRSARSAA